MAEEEFKIIFKYMDEVIKRQPELWDETLHETMVRSREIIELIETINAAKPPPREPLLYSGT